jgi:hypothetical protein
MNWSSVGNLVHLLEELNQDGQPALEALSNLVAASQTGDPYQIVDAKYAFEKALIPLAGEIKAYFAKPETAARARMVPETAFGPTCARIFGGGGGGTGGGGGWLQTIIKLAPTIIAILQGLGVPVPPIHFPGT